ncbi:dTDP-4-dehydrorhamnose 3,5-epimerase [Seonamhaeicola maritimus]|uniref:dTDP-4-dehydrorhamnose 3,5-epimerase n=1 Tax=Seonamhaeicola maritimus TaxID=2591822 RepID=UPI002493D2ED|nr:dTDP-4-dehydrorhamnose 3,5-epimerase [Seonamhaeicola maritimus]
MIGTETSLKGCYIIEPTVYSDERGYFYESFNKEKFDAIIDYKVNFVQDNQSFSSKGVLRGLHYQLNEFAQAKLVRVLRGMVLDIAVDLRKASPTFGEYVAIELSAENKKQLFIPRGFAHGFVVLSDSAEFFYKCDNFYNKASEGGIIFNDSAIGIDWRLPQSELIVSDKDSILPTLDKAKL